MIFKKCLSEPIHNKNESVVFMLFVRNNISSKMIFVKRYISLNFIWLIAYCVSPIVNVDIECDAISNTDFGRRFCFIRHFNNKILHNVTFKYNPIAEEKREIIFDNCTLDELPLGMFKNFANIKTVYVWNIQLKELRNEVFQNANHLTAFDASKNSVQKLNQNTFSLATKLNQIDLSKNLIESMDVDAFSGLEKLNVLNLENNKLRFIPANGFAQLTQLKTIRLSHNLIKMIPLELFGQNTRLQNIYLNDNAIEWLFGEQTFQHLQHVNEFDLHNNPNANLANCVVNAKSINIQNTNTKGCYIGSRTRRIIANNNQISFIEVNDAVTGNLEHVELGNNRLQKMKNLTRFEKLSHLNLMNNQITDIGLNSFANMDKLEVLNLRNSGLSKIYFGLFSHKSKLKVLDISYNKLGIIDFRMFLSMPNLVRMQLDGNKLSEMDASEIRKIFPALSKIGISSNDWLCTNLASIIKHLEAYGIELEAFEPTKYIENIKGIPCCNENKTDNAELLNDRADSNEKPGVDDKIHSTTSNDSGEIECQSSQTCNTHLMLRLLQLKYDLQGSIQSLSEIEKKLEDIWNEHYNENGMKILNLK